MQPAVRVTVLLGLLCLTACGSSNECEEEGATECDRSGRAVRTCASTSDGLRWQSEVCGERTPSCVEQRGGTATCVAESLGECDGASYHDLCPDEHTLQTCVDGQIRRMVCADGEVCGEVPAHALGEGRSENASHACYAPRVPNEPPALVTFVHGDVRVGSAPAGTVPFRVAPGTALRLGEGAVAVVLVKERPTRLEGPREVDPYELQPESDVPAPWAAAVIDRLSNDPPEPIGPEETLLTPAPNADGTVHLLVGEGVPGASETLGIIAWRCDDGCGRTLELRALGSRERVIWRGNGEGRVRYDGPALEAGERYELVVGEQRYPIETEPPTDLRPLLASMRGWPLPETMSVIAAVHRWGGSRAAAVAVTVRTVIERHGADEDANRLRAAYLGE